MYKKAPVALSWGMGESRKIFPERIRERPAKIEKKLTNDTKTFECKSINPHLSLRTIGY